MYDYHATVTGIYDGDTIRTLVVLGGDVMQPWDIRLVGNQSPELGRVKDPIPAGELATKALMGMLGVERFEPYRARGYFGNFGSYPVILGREPHVFIQTHTDKRDKYGRMLADVWLWGQNPERDPTLNQLMRDGGWADIYPGGST